MKKMNYLRIRRSKKTNAVVSLQLKRDIFSILHVLTVKRYVLHSASEFLGERVFYFILKTAEIASHSSSAKSDFHDRACSF